MRRAAMRITAQDLKKLGIIDDIIAEPLGGAHRGREQAIAATGEAIARALDAFDGMSAGCAARPSGATNSWRSAAACNQTRLK